MAKKKPSLDEIEEFSNAVEQYAYKNELFYITALAVICDEFNIKEENVNDWISTNLKAKLSEEVQEEGIIEDRGNAALPL